MAEIDRGKRSNNKNNNNYTNSQTLSSSNTNITMSKNEDDKELHINSLLEYIGQKESDTLDRLYEHYSICMSVFRELPEIARHFIMRIIFVDQPVPKAVVNSWSSKKYDKEQEAAQQLLTSLNIWRLTAIPGGLQAWLLTPIFKQSLKAALLGGGERWVLSHAIEKSNKQRGVAFLDTYAMNRWRGVLHYLVGINIGKGGDSECISPDAVRIMLQSGLMCNSDEGHTITQRGFQFLLEDTQTQVWHFMLEYLNSCETRGLSFPRCFSLLLELSLATLGQNYSTERMKPDELIFLQHLREFGLVFQRKRKEGRFYPTRLATHIRMRGPPIYETTTQPNITQNHETSAETEALTKGFILVETNYRVYAYTDSPLHTAVLALFTELLYKFPNMIVGVVTRDSIRQALRVGITARQIMKYLEQHAHEKMRQTKYNIRSSSCLPPTVVDQILLWELERNRLSYVDGVVYNQFLTHVDFVTLRDYAISINQLVWQDERARTMVVAQNGHDDVRRFWKRYSKNSS